MDEQMNNMGQSQPRSSAVSWVTIVAVIVVLALGVWYFWGRNAGGNLDAITNQSSSDEAASIESDLNATQVDNPDYDLNPDNFTSS